MQRRNSDPRAAALGIAPYQTDDDWHLDSDAEQLDVDDTDDTPTDTDTDDQGGETA
jgi:hypothetical protein